MGNISVTLATLDLRLALYRGQENSTRDNVLYSVHRDKSLHHLWHRYCRILRARQRNDISVLADMARNGEEEKGPDEFARGKTGCQQTQQLK